MKYFLKSFIYAFQGVRFALSGRNFVVEVIIAVVVLAASFFFDITQGEWIAVLIAIALVLSFEMMNSAIEYLVNLVSPDYHPLAGKIKDIAAGAVLVVSLFAAVIGIIIFSKYFILLFNGNQAF